MVNDIENTFEKSLVNDIENTFEISLVNDIENTFEISLVNEGDNEASPGAERASSASRVWDVRKQTGKGS